MESFFGLSGRPFAAAPRTDRYFAARAIETARTTLVRAIERAEGPAIVVGSVGAGKTLLCRMLAEHFRGSLRVAQVAAGRIESRRALWQTLLYELNLPFRGMDDGELRLSLVGHLTAQSAAKPTLIIVDEAHLLSLRLLEEVRTLTDLLADGQPAVRLVLAGGSSLEEHFAHPKLETFSQRLCARCYLEPLTQAETRDYIAAQVAACDAVADSLFVDGALEAVHRATDGVPRLVNQLCDHGLVLAFAEGALQVTGEMIEEAWADLQQLPLPASIEAEATPLRDATIEFGCLDESDGHEFEPHIGDLSRAVFASTKSDECPVNQTVVLRPETTVEQDFTGESSRSAGIGQTQPILAMNIGGSSAPDDLMTAAGSPGRVAYDDLSLPADWLSTDNVVSAVSGSSSAQENSTPKPDENPFVEAFDDEESIVDPLASLHARAPFRRGAPLPPLRPKSPMDKSREVSARETSLTGEPEKPVARTDDAATKGVDAPWPSGTVMSLESASAAWPAATAYQTDNTASTDSVPGYEDHDETEEPAAPPARRTLKLVTVSAAQTAGSSVAAPPQPAATPRRAEPSDKGQAGKPRGGDLGQLFTRLRKKTNR